jgi:hypothetical protein
MTTTTTTPRPDVPLPAGATFVDSWDTDGTAMPYRFVNFAAGTVTDHKVKVSTYAFQLADGSLASAGDQAPGILLSDSSDSSDPLNSDQARELAAALLAAAAEIDRLEAQR